MRFSFSHGRVRLGHGNPPALEALRSRRDELVKALAATQGEFADAPDYSSINRALNDTELIGALFDMILAYDDSTATQQMIRDAAPRAGRPALFAP